MNGDCNICINGKLPSYSASCVECGLLRKNYKPMTNADRIRGMTDEELAHFIAGQCGWYCDFKDTEEEDYPKILDWLKSQVEVDNGT